MSPTPSQIAAAVDPDEVVSFLQALVQAETPNPPGNEVAAADASERILSSLGLESLRLEPAPGRVNVVADWGNNEGPTLLFNGHYDVVPATDVDHWPHKPFDAVVADGKLHGRGSCDMKGGIAAALGAIAAMIRTGFEPKGKLAFHLVADEEAMGEWGTKWLLDNGYCQGVTECVCGEPTQLNLVTSERGAYWIRVTTEGVSAHGSTPQLGVSAIEHMTHVIQALLAMRFRKLHEVLGTASINVGTIVGGAKVNSVPDRCSIEVDRRTIPGETREDVTAEIEAVLQGVRQTVPGMKVSFEPVIWADACETPADTRMIQLLREARTSLGGDCVELGYGGATDARFLNMAGIPSVIFGPGNLLLAHTTGEHIEIDELVECARTYAHAFSTFLSS